MVIYNFQEHLNARASLSLKGKSMTDSVIPEEQPPSIKDHTFFKNIGSYGQVQIPTDMRKKFGVIDDDFYAMIVVIPVVTRISSLTREEAYEYLKYLISQSERTPE